ncbi:MAG: alanine/glycine:cation symporter family protein [Pirellulales bacterium]
MRHLIRRFGISNLLFLIGLTSFAFWGYQASFAQEAPVNESEPVEVESAELEPDSTEAAQADEIELDEPPSLTEQIDGLFSKAVGLMADYLFHRVFSAEKEYVQYEQVINYVRDRDSKEDFVLYERNVQEKPEKLPVQLSEKQAGNYQLLGKLKTSKDDRSYRLGKLNKKPIEYVTYVVNEDAKYVKLSQAGETTYRKIGPLRGLPSEDKNDWLTEDQVSDLGRQGYLKFRSAEDIAKDPSKPVYLLTEKVGGAPIVVLWLSGGAIFFTIYMGFVNFWGFSHAVSVVRGTYDDPDEPGEVTHFQALASALSATVGLGNISGVTIAMVLGGPGAFFWMLLCGLFGMTSKFVECTLGQKYREVKPDGTVIGGPMRYLQVSFEQFGLKPVGVLLSVIFSVMCIMASFGGGNMFQANQSSATVLGLIQREEVKTISELGKSIKNNIEQNDLLLISDTDTQEEKDAILAKKSNLEAAKEKLQGDKKKLVDSTQSFAKQFNTIFGLVMAALVAMVIIGGIKRIGAAASKIVPTMCLMYIAACLWIIFGHITEVPALIGMIFTQAFSGEAVRGGLLGVIVIGVQRAAFSNEAGVGSAAIAHSAAKTDQPVREGMVALLGPFIDTIVVCSMTALVILITGAWENKEWIVDQGLEGAKLTSAAFGEEIEFFPYILAVAVVLFAFSTIISWSYYGERCWEQLFGARSTPIYKAIYVGCVVLGSIVHLGAVLDFSDMMILVMAFPNILGAVLLAPKVKHDLKEYWRKYKAGEFKKFK